jgi:hypothetical protein
MNRTAENVVLTIVATLVCLGLAAISGRTAMNGGLGEDGALYQAMAVNHDLQAAPAVKKLAPAFPLAAAIGYAATGNIVSSFFLVNVMAFVVLTFAACWTLDLAGAPLGVKVATAATLALLGHPSLTGIYDPGQPYLLGVALLALAIAAAEWSSGVLTAVLQIGATFASPVGIVAPLYGMWRHWRARRPAAMLVVYAPALLVWLAVQYWARGGAAGLVDLMRISRVRSDAAFWAESVFILYAIYFLVTSLGGLTLLLWSSPRRLRDALTSRPELLALVIPVIPFLRRPSHHHVSSTVLVFPHRRLGTRQLGAVDGPARTCDRADPRHAAPMDAHHRHQLFRGLVSLLGRGRPRERHRCRL